MPEDKDKKQAAGDAPQSKKEKEKNKLDVPHGKKAKQEADASEEKKVKAKSDASEGKKEQAHGKEKGKGHSSQERSEKDKAHGKFEKEKDKVDITQGKKEKDDVSQKKKEGVNQEEIPEAEELPKSFSQIAKEEAEYRALLRRQRFKRKWPEVTKVKIHTKPWHPPPPPQRMPPIPIDLPQLTTRPWVPPDRRRRAPRPKLMRVPPEEVTQPLYECSNLKRIWHNFLQVEPNKMILQGTIGCNSKKYSSTTCGSQTACIAVMCRVLLEEKTPAQLVKKDVDDLVEHGDRYYRQCMLAMKCYKGKPQLELNQLLPHLFFHDYKYTVHMEDMEKGVLAQHPDSVKQEPDFMGMMEKRIGTTFMMILTVGDKHFLIWGHPPNPGTESHVKTICYIFDPHELNELGQPKSFIPCQRRAGAFLRYAGIASFVLDFLGNYGDLEALKKGAKCMPRIAFTGIEVVQKEKFEREPNYEVDLKTLKIHCPSEWESIHKNVLLDKKINQGQYPLASLSAVSLAASRVASRNRVGDFYQKTPKEPSPTLPMQPEKPPPPPTVEQIMQLRGEDFFLYCPKQDAHSYGRDDMIPLPKSETMIHSPVELADKNFISQFAQLDVDRWILIGTRHMASHRYQLFKSYTGIPCCVAALGMLRKIQARGWNEDIVDETLDVGWNILRESLVERGGPVRRLVLGELKDTFKIRDTQYKHKGRAVAVWGKLISQETKVLDLYRGIKNFFKQYDTGILQLPGEFEVAIWREGGKFYVYHPWPADRYGYRVGLREGGKACLLAFANKSRLCEHYMESVFKVKRKPFSISNVEIWEIPREMPEPVNNMNPVAPGRWIVRGHFHEGDDRFPEDHRNRQATPTAIAAIAMSHLVPPDSWSPDDIDQTLIRGDILYQSTIEYLERMGISLDTPRNTEEAEEEEELPTGMLAAVDVKNRFKMSDYDCIETEVMDGAFSGHLNPEPGSGVLSLKDSLKQLFKDYTHGVVTARGGSMAVWRDDDHLYFFDPHGCDEYGLPSDEPRAGACLVRLKGDAEELAKVIMGNLTPGGDDSFNISPVEVLSSKLNPALGAPETRLESQAFEWINKGTAAVMMGPRGENSAIGKAARKAAIGDEDMAGRTIALPAAAAFTAATVSVPPPHMHQDHMFHFLDAGADYYTNHVKTTGRKTISPEDLTEKFEMGANTFSIELGEPLYNRLPLWIPAKGGEGAGDEEEEKELLEGEEEEEAKEPPLKQIKEALFKIWADDTKPTTVSLLVGDYHQLGVWMASGGPVVVFDPAPTLTKGVLTQQRILKGDELRLQRIKDEMSGEGGAVEDEEELAGEGEAVPEPEPQFVPPESAPVLMIFASPEEFIDKLVLQGGLNKTQCLAPYKIYPVTVTNELTSVLKEKRPSAKKEEEAVVDEEEEESLVEPLDDAAMGKYFTRFGRAVASLRGNVAQHQSYFMETPNRDNQDAAISVMGIVVEYIEPYVFWKPELIDAVMKYGDRLYTLSLPNAAAPPRLKAEEVVKEFHVTNFNVKLEIEPDIAVGDIKAGLTGPVLNLVRGLKKFLETEKYGVLCAKDYCVGFWVAADDKAICLWDPHSVGPTGKSSFPEGAAGLVLFSTVEELADTLKENMEGLSRPGTNKFSIASVKVHWEFAPTPTPYTPPGTVPDEGYEYKVLTGFVETARGRTILRGSRPPDAMKFTRDSLLQSSCGAVVAACMSHVRKPHLWTRRTVDEVMAISSDVFNASVSALGYEFRPGDDVLLPLQVVKRFVLGVNYVRYDLTLAYSGKLEQKKHAEMTLRAAVEQFFETETTGILWSAPHAVAVWRVPGVPTFYMMEPHACGPTGLRVDAEDEGAACVLTFSSPKLLAFGYLQNIPVAEHPRHDFQMYTMAIVVQPIKKLGGVDPPLVRVPPGAKPGVTLLPATSKVGVDGTKRRADEANRKHPPGSVTCLDAQRCADEQDKQRDLQGVRNSSGWLVLSDGQQFLSAQHSMACRKYPHGSRGNQALTCAVMAVAMSRVEDICRWSTNTLDQILDSGDQLYQDSYLHFKPRRTKILNIQQILRKFYTPGNCVCRVVVYQARQVGRVDTDVYEKVLQFFREEKTGVFVAGDGDFAVALFRTPRGFYMFDAADRDRYGRAVAPPCIGRARACFSQYPSVLSLANKLSANIPPVMQEPPIEVIKPSIQLGKEKEDSNKPQTNVTTPGPVVATPDPVKEDTTKEDEAKASFLEPASFAIYGLEVTSLRKLNKHEQ